jgi:Domain of unknown function (DUF3473)
VAGLLVVQDLPEVAFVHRLPAFRAHVEVLALLRRLAAGPFADDAECWIVRGANEGRFAITLVTRQIVCDFNLNSLGYLRLLPEQMIRYGFERFSKANLPVAVYLYPRDFAPDQPRASMPPHRRFKPYVGLRTTKRKLRMLLSKYRFDTCAVIRFVGDSALTPSGPSPTSRGHRGCARIRWMAGLRSRT